MSNFSTDEWSKLVGKKVISDYGNIYRVVSLARDPLVCLEAEDGNRIDFCVGSLMSKGWKKYEEPLKTAKDLRFTWQGLINLLEYDKLKDLAIKRVKEWKHEHSDFSSGRQNALIILFDLTEEDLMTNEEINARENGEVGNN